MSGNKESLLIGDLVYIVTDSFIDSLVGDKAPLGLVVQTRPAAGVYKIQLLNSKAKTEPYWVSIFYLRKAKQ